MTEQSAGHLIVESLKHHGVERVFSVPGESYLDVLDGLYNSGIENVVCRQEGGALYMAEAVGKATGRPGVAMVTRGPGASNAFVGIHLAWQDSTPLVLFVGLIPLDHRMKEAFQELDPYAWFGTQTKRVFVLDKAERASEVVAEAFFAATSGRPGPVVVGLPEDVITDMVDRPVVPRIPVTEGSVSDQELADLTHAFSTAQRPALLLGGPRWNAVASQQVTAFAEKNGIPVISDWRAADRIPGNSPVNAGELGYRRTEESVAVLKDADLLVLVGGTLSDIPTDGFTVRQEPDATNWIVNIDASLRQHSGAVTRQILASPVAFGHAVADLDLGEHPDWSSWRDPAVAAHQEVSRIPDNTGTNAEGTADMTLVMAEVLKRMPEDTQITFGSGNHTAWGHRYFPNSFYPSQFSVRNGTMGYSVPAAVALSLQDKDRFVFSIAGDGEFLMNSQELATAKQFGAHPLILVMDNSQFGTIRSHQETRYPGRISGTQLENPDFGVLGQGYGGYGARLDNNGDIERVIGEAMTAVQENRVPAVVHVVVDRSKVMPDG
ncbi:thiamine pyrophosphate-binding protein [Kocuria sp.]|uniref:thiamine pyrophosphate-binding protein n=1 Tax=Kocuria sp. TaxID=1871328 RepID=UPI0026E02F29|nr:thiamine pyrophosphate-binding protein [Kocuria sp.]MDO5367982.1 thiamine pyrophosphate-binding protein [Kocuria sp.]